MKAGAFKDPDVIALQNDAYVSVALNIDDAAAKAKLTELGGRGIPYVVVVGADGKTVDTKTGSTGAGAYATFLRETAEKTGPPRERVEAYLRTLGPVSDARRDELAGHVAALAADAVADRDAASEALRALGAPALAALRDLKTDDPEVQARARRIVQAIEPLQKHVAARGLDRAVPALIAANAEARLREILPEAAHADPAGWWEAHGASARWTGARYE